MIAWGQKNSRDHQPRWFRAPLSCALAICVVLPSLPIACADHKDAAVEDTKGIHSEQEFTRKREELVHKSIESAGVKDAKVLAAMRKVPRHKFVPESARDSAYEDHPLPIGHGQTISQPSLVAIMTQLLNLNSEDKVLEIGTGSGYQAAILAEIVKQVYTIEIVEPLGREAEARLNEMGYKNIHVKIGDGYKGWPGVAPYDAIIVTCAPEKVPTPLVDELKVGGRMCIPVGPNWREQTLYLMTRLPDGSLNQQRVLSVGFVPMTHGKD